MDPVSSLIYTGFIRSFLLGKLSELVSIIKNVKQEQNIEG